ncbi:MAG: hypothetical protein ACRDYX_21230 [Egibacteraceae bacterium]
MGAAGFVVRAAQPPGAGGQDVEVVVGQAERAQPDRLLAFGGQQPDAALVPATSDAV